MRAGKLNKRVTIQQVTETQNGTGEPIETWSTFATVYAAVIPLEQQSGQEPFRGAIRQAEETHRVEMRYRPGITAKMRVLYGTRIFNIQSLPDVNERHREAHLYCKELVA